MIDAATFGAPNWVDLSTADITSATRFYSRLLGWDVDVIASEMGDYHVGKIGDFEVAGMMAQDPAMRGMPTVWTTFIYVENVTATVHHVEESGGKVVQPPFEIPGGAWVSVVVDSTGAMFSVISGGETPEGMYFSNEPGRVCWVELLTRDPAAASAFYSDVFGWDPAIDSSGGTEYTVFELGDENVCGMLMMPVEVPAAAPAHWSVYFAVADCEDAARHATELGGRVLRPPTEIGTGKFAVLEDPQGGVFNVMEMVGA
jgi:predicted enzyme related to lactoylglutathione lyase